MKPNPNLIKNPLNFKNKPVENKLSSFQPEPSYVPDQTPVKSVIIVNKPVVRINAEAENKQYTRLQDLKDMVWLETAELDA